MNCVMRIPIEHIYTRAKFKHDTLYHQAATYIHRLHELYTTNHRPLNISPHIYQNVKYHSRSPRRLGKIPFSHMSRNGPSFPGHWRMEMGRRVDRMYSKASSEPIFFLLLLLATMVFRLFGVACVRTRSCFWGV